MSEAAFPTPVSMNGHNKHHSNHKGMTLRDYFAAKAMQALVQANFRSQEVIPHYAYILADAMLKERNGNT